jgi:hypothetical protein
MRSIGERPQLVFPGSALIAFLLLSSCSGDSRNQQDWLIIPETRVGPIDAQTTEKTLIARIGANHVRRRLAEIGEGLCSPGSIVFYGTPDSVEIVWQDSTYTTPAVVHVAGPHSRWRTPAGVRVGLELDELVAMSGRPFQFQGFGWDYGGAGTWSEPIGGEKRSLQIRLSPDSASIANAYQDSLSDEIMGEKPINSNHPLIKTMNISVESIVIRWHEPTVQYQCPNL